MLNKKILVGGAGKEAPPCNTYGRAQIRDGPCFIWVAGI